MVALEEEQTWQVGIRPVAVQNHGQLCESRTTVYYLHDLIS